MPHPFRPETHETYTAQICAEVQREKFIKDRGTVSTWVQIKNHPNHYLDCGYLATAAADFVAANRIRTVVTMSETHQRPPLTQHVPGRQPLVSGTERYAGRIKLSQVVRR